MTEAKRKLQILLLVAISLIILAAPARSGDWFGVGIGPDGFSLSFGFSNWAVYGSSWSDPSWRVDYHTALSGYGEWVWIDGLGQCWRPWVAAGWRPFCHGRWVWTPLGWTWVAYEPWGYFPHHYGNWALSSHGWVWTPGYDYRPANVVWVGAGGFVGWYASPPPGWSHARRGWHHGARDGRPIGFDRGGFTGWHDAQHATYARWRDFGADDISRHAVTHGTVRRSEAAASIRAGIGAPDRDGLDRRGIDTPRMDVESRVIRLGDRQVTVTRPKGAGIDVRRHAEPTVERALARQPQPANVSRVRDDPKPTTQSSRGPTGSRSPVLSDRGRPETARSAVSSRTDRAPSGTATRPAGHRNPDTAGTRLESGDGQRGGRAEEPRSSGPSNARPRSESARPAASRVQTAGSPDRPEPARTRTTPSNRTGRTTASNARSQPSEGGEPDVADQRRLGPQRRGDSVEERRARR